MKSMGAIINYIVKNRQLESIVVLTMQQAKMNQKLFQKNTNKNQSIKKKTFKIHKIFIIKHKTYIKIFIEISKQLQL